LGSRVQFHNLKNHTSKDRELNPHPPLERWRAIMPRPRTDRVAATAFYLNTPVKAAKIHCDLNRRNDSGPFAGGAKMA
jgi:hypothetical protein